jgi:hypothetical protein
MVSRRTRVVSWIFRRDHPSRPKTLICCFFSSFKTFAMLREATYPPAAVNVLDVSSESMAAFQVFLYGRFWVFTEELVERYARCDGLRHGRRAEGVGAELSTQNAKRGPRVMQRCDQHGHGQTREQYKEKASGSRRSRIDPLASIRRTSRRDFAWLGFCYVVSVFDDNSGHFRIDESKRHHRSLLHI